MIDPNTMSSEEGSIIQNGPASANELGLGGTGEPQESENEFKTLYENAEKKIGELGNEVGEWRSFFDGISPLLEKLDKSPTLVNAIVEGKVDENLAKSVIEGKISLDDAKIITKAHTEIKKELGKNYTGATTEEIANLVEQKTTAIKKELEDKILESEKLKSFEDSVNDFIDKTPDFAKYANKVEEWLDKHQDVTDIKIAYYAVKGELSEMEALEKAQQEQVEYEKSIALNTAGGGSKRLNIPEGVNPADVFIGTKSNPNIF
jgi:soluble cytochrome b562